MKIFTSVMSAALVLGTLGYAVAQSGGDAGATGMRNGGASPSQNNQSGTTDKKGPAKATPGAATGVGTYSSGASTGQMGDCPVGEARTAAADGTKSPCKKM